MQPQPCNWTQLARLIVLVTAVSVELGAQRPVRRPNSGVSLGISRVGSANRFIGVASAPHVQVALGRSFGSRLAASVLFDAYMMETIEAIPGCVVGAAGPCGARTQRPGTLVGLSAEGRYYPWMDGLGIAAGVGAYTAPSVRGQVSRSSAAVSLGADYEFLGGSRWLPVLGFRYTRLTGDVAGIRWIVSPAAGLRF